MCYFTIKCIYIFRIVYLEFCVKYISVSSILGKKCPLEWITFCLILSDMNRWWWHEKEIVEVLTCCQWHTALLLMLGDFTEAVWDIFNVRRDGGQHQTVTHTIHLHRTQCQLFNQTGTILNEAKEAETQWTGTHRCHYSNSESWAENLTFKVKQWKEGRKEGNWKCKVKSVWMTHNTI